MKESVASGSAFIIGGVRGARRCAAQRIGGFFTKILKTGHRFH
ncbi:hypothetical protein C7S16_1099 [Burkholderia thailandensis]|uniref:Uncharacterized protein n=1 Tax=Burkholderia thailandensis TaxID=57975 RepID=A0AAW9D5H7_BURTH|nr:hypothetical protein [Burkholderia thailandensis]